MSSAYAKLTPARQLFVDGIVAGEKGTQLVRKLRPHLKEPKVLASKWKARADVRAAIAERQAERSRLEARVARLETLGAMLVERAGGGTLQ